MPDRSRMLSSNGRAELQRVRDAVAARQRAESEYRLALIAAIQAGASYRAVAKAAGHRSTSTVQAIVGARGS